MRRSSRSRITSGFSPMNMKCEYAVPSYVALAYAAYIGYVARNCAVLIITSSLISRINDDGLRKIIAACKGDTDKETQACDALLVFHNHLLNRHLHL